MSPHVSAVFTGGWWWWWCTPSRAHHATDTGRGAVARPSPPRPPRTGCRSETPRTAERTGSYRSFSVRAAGPALVLPSPPSLRGTTAEAFGFNKPLEIVKPGVWCRVLGCLRCCVWSLAVKLIQCKLDPRSAHGAVLSAAAPNDQSAKSAYLGQWRF